MKSMKEGDITHEELISILNYNPDTGIFIWKIRSPNMFEDKPQYPKEWGCKRWNVQFAGRVAGSIQLKRNRGTQHNIIGIKFKDRNQIRCSASRLAWFYVTKKFPKDCIDHIDGNTLNDRWENLREATSQQNSWNSKLVSTNTTGYRGVSYIKDLNRYRACISVGNGKSKHIGYFNTAKEAGEAYLKKAKELRGEFVRDEKYL